MVSLLAFPQEPGNGGSQSCLEPNAGPLECALWFAGPQLLFRVYLGDSWSCWVEIFSFWAVMDVPLGLVFMHASGINIFET